MLTLWVLVSMVSRPVSTMDEGNHIVQYTCGNESETPRVNRPLAHNYLFVQVEFDCDLGDALLNALAGEDKDCSMHACVHVK